MYVCVREKASECVCMCARKRDRERESVCERERVYSAGKIIILEIVRPK